MDESSLRLESQGSLARYAVWRTAATLARRHPGSFGCIRNFAHNGDGVTLFTADQRNHVFINQYGAINVFGSKKHLNFPLKIAIGPGSHQMIQEIEAACGFDSPKATPSTTSDSIGFLCLEELVRQESLNGDLLASPELSVFCAISDGDYGADSSTLMGFPEGTDFSLDSEYRAWRYWLVGVQGIVPRLIAFDLATGQAWINSRHYDLMLAYQSQGRDVEALVKFLKVETER
jgi:hypothetical protein